MNYAELLYFAGCPNVGAARELLARVAADEGLDLDLRLTEVATPEDAVRLRFLGSPSIRVDGHDVEPGADGRDAFVFACRVYRTPEGLSGTPTYEWVRSALRGH